MAKITVLSNYYHLSKNHQTHATRTTFCNTPEQVLCTNIFTLVRSNTQGKYHPICRYQWRVIMLHWQLSASCRSNASYIHERCRNCN